MIRTTTLLALLLIFAFSFGESFAQDSTSETKKRNIKNRVDNIVKDVFAQVERELGTKIFDDDSADDEDYNADSNNFDEYTSEDETFEYEFPQAERYSLFAFPTDRGIPRNNSAKINLANLDDKFLFRYNRVEGLFLGIQSPQKFFWDRERKFALFGSIGYGFGVHKWEYQAGASQQFGSDNRLFEFGIEGHSVVDTRDQWLVGNLENTLNALLLRYDYRDYFLRSGFSTWAGYYTRNQLADMQLKISFANDEYASLNNNVNWSLFRTKKSFRINPEINNGKIHSIILALDLHKMDDRKLHLAGWSTAFTAEFAGKSFKGDYEFNRYVFDARRYQPLGKYDNLNFRFRAATSNGILPNQRAYELGGISTLPAYMYKEFIGNRFLLANIEYVVNGKMFSDDTGFPFSMFSSMNIILFYDAGYINTVSDEVTFDEGFDSFKLNSLKSDLGFAFGSRDGKYRLGFAWKTDVKSPVSVFFRMSRPF